MGFMAGPESPPIIFPNSGFLEWILMAMALKVLTREMASAPSSSVILAREAISVTLGDNFTMRGNWVDFLTARTRRYVILGSEQKAIPPCFTLGQEMFISSPEIPGTSFKHPANSIYSFWVFPKKLTIKWVLILVRKGSLSLRNSWNPGF